MLGLRSLTTAMAVALLASPLGAQRVWSDTSAVRVTPAVASAGMRLASDSLALLSPKSAPAWTKVGPMHINAGVSVRRILAPESSQSAAMMIVGGTALLVGAVVSGRPGSIIMISGGVVGLVGLWRYAR